MSFSHAAPRPNEHGGLVVRGLRKSFLAGVQGCHARARVLHDVDLDIRAGEIVGICGAAGSGKTTLLLCLAGLLKPDAGHIIVCGAAPGRLTSYVAPASPNDSLTPTQRLGRALAAGSPVLLLDGVLADLSTGAGALLGQLASRGMTIVAAERQWMRLEPVVERVMTLHEGTVCTDTLNAVAESAGAKVASRVAEPNGRGRYR
ncbi:MAG TPA: ATP-binding cassette domain-containing protein [Gemmatimonadaceae bacterium]|nr:ATP-binding cassette domain-containing protein [Gemmatimonadaceae bacterium]